MSHPDQPTPPAGLSHLNAAGEAHMVNVGPKAITERRATACGWLKVLPETLERLQEGNTPKGDVFATARIAGIQGAKKTSDLIPLCHPLKIVKVSVDISANRQTSCIEVSSTVVAVDRTGVEMEALTATTLACLTLYDMLKAIDKSMLIGEIYLQKKTGGQSGDIERSTP